MLVMAFCSISYAAPQATLPDSEMSLGGLTLGMSLEAVQDHYGAPDKIISKNNSLTYNYGGTVEIFFKKNPYNNNPNVELESIKATANNGFSTPSGLRVGMTYTEVVNIYGKHPALAGPPTGNNSSYYYYGSNGRRILISTVNKKVTEIMVYQGM